MKQHPQPRAVIVAHGQPSDPAPAAAEIAALGARVAMHLSGWDIRTATLAEDGALAQAVAGADRGLVYPLFMAAGWFTQTYLPAKLAEAGAKGWPVLAPFGIDDCMTNLALKILAEAGLQQGGEVLLAAHGSFKSAAPSQVAFDLVARIKAQFAPARAEAAFIDQSPRLAEATGFAAHAICLPFFAAKGGHVVDDLPAALSEAGFTGRTLPPLGLDPRVPALIARRILAEAFRMRL